MPGLAPILGYPFEIEEGRPEALEAPFKRSRKPKARCKRGRRGVTRKWR